MSIEFSAEQKALLGIEEDETLRLLLANSAFILLDRVRPEGPRAYPWDRDLVLTADIRAFSFADILHTIHESSKSGYLAFENGQQSKSVYLHRGEVVFATSNQTVDRLGPCLLRNGMLTAEQYRDAVSAYSSSTHFGKILVERGYLTPRQIWNGVKSQVEEIVRSLFAHEAGTVLFWEGEVRPDNVVRLSLPTRRLIAEGLKRRDDLLKFLAFLEDPRIELRVTPGSSLNGNERAICEALQSEGNFGAACRSAGLDPLTAARTVSLLRLLGAVTVGRCEEGDEGHSQADARIGDDESLRECVELHVKLLGELAAPIVAVEGGVALQNRLSLVIDDAAKRYSAILGGIQVGPNATLDPKELINRALRFPGDRESEVSAALGELVSYLEFDLVNHPDIDDPEVFLDAIDPLRVRL